MICSASSVKEAFVFYLSGALPREYVAVRGLWWPGTSTLT